MSKFIDFITKILFIWVKVRVFPKSLNEDKATSLKQLEIVASKHTCYVLYSFSIIDFLVLRKICKDYALPLPSLGKYKENSASVVFLYSRSLLRVRRGKNRKLPKKITYFVNETFKNKKLSIQFVSSNIFWGRNPGKKESSLFKLLFFDDKNAGIFQKLLISIAHGRSTFLHFHKAIPLEVIRKGDTDKNQIAKKINRILRVKHNEQNTSFKGPQFPSREIIISTIMNSRNIKDIIKKDSKKNNKSIEKVEQRARNIIAEIASEPNQSVIRLFEITLSWLWNKIFSGVKVNNFEKIPELLKDHEVIYIPSHKSHMDYLLLIYTLYHSGLMISHTVAGINLNFWPAGPLLRRGGAFFIRRKNFSSDYLYSSIFTEYVHYLIQNGHAMKFYIEGGRSRTGRLSEPKVGILNMIIHSHLRDSYRPIVFIPINLTYDKVVEIKSYVKELSGKTKKTESIKQLLSVPKLLRQNFGKAYINFGEPIFLDKYISENGSPLEVGEKIDDKSPTSLISFSKELSKSILYEINKSAIINPVSLVSFVILGTQTKTITEKELKFFMQCFIGVVNDLKYLKNVYIDKTTIDEKLTTVLEVADINRIVHTSGNVLQVDQSQALMLSYYSNSIKHLYSLSALICSYFTNHNCIDEIKLLKYLSELAVLLKNEFKITWISESEISATLNALVVNGLLLRDGGIISRPDFQNIEFKAMKILANSLKKEISSYYLLINIVYLSKDKATSQSKVIKHCKIMSDHFSVLSGDENKLLFDAKLFDRTFKELVALEYIELVAKGEIVVKDKMNFLIAAISPLMEQNIKQSLELFVKNEL